MRYFLLFKQSFIRLKEILVKDDFRVFFLKDNLREIEVPVVYDL